MRVGNGALFCSLKYISSAFRHCAGGSFFFAVGPFGPAAFFISLSRGRVAAGVQEKPQKEPHMANKNTNPGIGESVDSGVCGYIVLRALPIAKWDVWDARDAWDNGFLKLALRASRRI